MITLIFYATLHTPKLCIMQKWRCECLKKLLMLIKIINGANIKIYELLTNIFCYIMSLSKGFYPNRSNIYFIIYHQP